MREMKDEIGGFCEIDVKEAKREDVRVPTLQKKLKLIKPFEFIVNMYGAPSYKDIDPTLITAIIFPPFFLGLCFPM
jgi:V/A-type H+-transporting ATPase subunit I